MAHGLHGLGRTGRGDALAGGPLDRQPLLAAGRGTTRRLALRPHAGGQRRRAFARSVAGPSAPGRGPASRGGRTGRHAHRCHGRGARSRRTDAPHGRAQRLRRALDRPPPAPRRPHHRAGRGMGRPRRGRKTATRRSMAQRRARGRSLPLQRPRGHRLAAEPPRVGHSLQPGLRRLPHI